MIRPLGCIRAALSDSRKVVAVFDIMREGSTILVCKAARQIVPGGLCFGYADCFVRWAGFSSKYLSHVCDSSSKTYQAYRL